MFVSLEWCFEKQAEKRSWLFIQLTESLQCFLFCLVFDVKFFVLDFRWENVGFEPLLIIQLFLSNFIILEKERLIVAEIFSYCIKAPFLLVIYFGSNQEVFQ